MKNFIYLKINNNEKAIEDLKISIELDSDFVEAIQLLESLGNNINYNLNKKGN
jgi:hypothetical protein